MISIFIGIGGTAITFFFFGFIVGRILFPSKPFLADDIKECPRCGGTNLYKGDNYITQCFCGGEYDQKRNS